MDVVCYYVDWGRPYGPLLRNMAESAKRVMPECRTVLLTPTPMCDGAAHFDAVYQSPEIKEKDGIALLSLSRCQANVSWQAQSQTETIYCDPDVEFLRRPVFRDEDDICLLWRDKPDQRVNAALFYSKPGQRYFWERYGRIVQSMPAEMQAWWSDQMAFTLMVGSYCEPGGSRHCDGSVVRFMDPKYTCGNPEDIDAQAFAVHRKGRRKGPGWEKWFDTPVKHVAAA